MKLIAVILAALTTLAATPAAGAPGCGERARLLATLEEKYNERPIARGLTNTGGVLEVLTSSSGTWTFLITYPDGRTCLVASGEGWETFEAEQGELL